MVGKVFKRPHGGWGMFSKNLKNIHPCPIPVVLYWDIYSVISIHECPLNVLYLILSWIFSQTVSWSTYTHISLWDNWSFSIYDLQMNVFYIVSLYTFSQTVFLGQSISILQSWQPDVQSLWSHASCSLQSLVGNSLAWPTRVLVFPMWTTLCPGLWMQWDGMLGLVVRLFISP